VTITKRGCTFFSLFVPILFEDDDEDERDSADRCHLPPATRLGRGFEYCLIPKT
jgi:hypothetical protein